MSEYSLQAISGGKDVDVINLRSKGSTRSVSGDTSVHAVSLDENVIPRSAIAVESRGKPNVCITSIELSSRE